MIHLPGPLLTVLAVVLVVVVVSAVAIAVLPSKTDRMGGGPADDRDPTT